MNRKWLEIIMAVIFIAGVVCTMEFGLQKAAETVTEPTAEDKTQIPEKPTADSVTETAEDEIFARRFTVVIDPGHGGIDPGKVGAYGSLEKDINLEIAQKLKNCLVLAGYRVVMTREDGNGLYDESDVNKKAADLRKRCGIVENSAADLFVSIHQNSYTDPDVSGAQVFFYKHSAQGEKLAAILQKRIRDEADPDNGRSSKSNDNYYMLLHTPCPAVIVECGFLSCPSEEKKLNDGEYQQKIAQAIAGGIDEYFGNGSGK